MRSVFDYMNAVTLGDLKEVVHLTRVTSEMDRDDSPGSRSDGAFDCDRIDRKCLRFAINKHRASSEVSHDLASRSESDGWQNDFVTLLQADSIQSEVQRRRARVECN